jgi:hypothetical protein
MKTPRDQGALDAPILFQGTNQARRGSHKRPRPEMARGQPPGGRGTLLGVGPAWVSSQCFDMARASSPSL